MISQKKPLALCEICVRQISADADNVTICENSLECQLCFGIMDQAMIDEVSIFWTCYYLNCSIFYFQVGEKVQEELEKLPYDSNSFILALNLPVGQTLR